MIFSYIPNLHMQARENHIEDVDSFYKSDEFRKRRYILKKSDGFIVKEL